MDSIRDQTVDKQVRNYKREGLVAIFIILLFFVFVIVYNYNKSNGSKNVLSLFSDFSYNSISKFGYSIIIVFLFYDVIRVFNSAIILPVVQILFPNTDFWQTKIYLGRDSEMYPGLFFQTMISFILSTTIVFVVFKLVMNIVPKIKNRTKKYILGGTVLLFIIGLIVWNIVDIYSENNNSSSRSLNQNKDKNPYSIRF